MKKTPSAQQPKPLASVETNLPSKAEEARNTREFFLQKLRKKIIVVEEERFVVSNLGFTTMEYKEIEFDLVDAKGQSSDPVFKTAGKIMRPEGSRFAHLRMPFYDLKNHIKTA